MTSAAVDRAADHLGGPPPRRPSRPPSRGSGCRARSVKVGVRIERAGAAACRGPPWSDSCPAARPARPRPVDTAAAVSANRTWPFSTTRSPTASRPRAEAGVVRHPLIGPTGGIVDHDVGAGRQGGGRRRRGELRRLGDPSRPGSGRARRPAPWRTARSTHPAPAAIFRFRSGRVEAHLLVAANSQAAEEGVVVLRA